MDESSSSTLQSSSCCKKSKLHGEKEEDRITNLPVSILHIILSFLDMKCVIRTSILSKKWRYLWTSVPFLYFNFDDHHYYSRNEMKFLDFVDKVLCLRDASNIQTLRLFIGKSITCNINYLSVSPLDKWIHVAVWRNVQELHLCLVYPFRNFKLLHYLYFSKSLKILKFDLTAKDEGRRGRRERTIFELPKKMRLPNLKILHFKSVCFTDSDFTHKFFSGCPVLDTLIFTNCEVEKSNNLTISTNQLKYLVIDGWYQKDHPFMIKISAPNLTSFMCKAYISYEYSLKNLWFLHKADIDMDIQDFYHMNEEDIGPSLIRKRSFGREMVHLLSGLCYVTSLTISSWLLEVIPETIGTLPTTFSLLRDLRMKTWLSKDCIRGIYYLLKISPHVENLVVEITTMRLSENLISPYCDETNICLTKMEEYQETNLLPECMFCYLKFVEIRNILGCINELELLKLLLKNANALEKLTIFISEEESTNANRKRRIRKFGETLQTFQRASSEITTFLF